VFASVQRPSMIEGAGDSAETHHANDFRIRSESSAQFTASFRPPPPLLHPLDTHYPSPEDLCVCLGSRRRHTGDFTRCPSDGETDAAECGCYSASPCPPDMGLVRLIVYLAFRATPNVLVRGETSLLFPHFLGEEGEEVRLQDQAGLSCWIYLIRLKETGHLSDLLEFGFLFVEF